MNAEDLEIYVGKHIRLLTKDNFSYTGTIEELRGETLYFRDKFGQIILLDASNIARVSPFDIIGGGR